MPCRRDSIGLFHLTYSAFLGFEVNEGEYEVMGLSSYGNPRYVDRVYRTIRRNADASIPLVPESYAFDGAGLVEVIRFRSCEPVRYKRRFFPCGTSASDLIEDHTSVPGMEA